MGVFNRMAGEKVYCGLDIGSQRVKAGLVKVREFNELELLGVYECPTAGFKDSSVRNLAELSECIHRAISGLARQTGCKLQDIELGIGGDLVLSRHSQTIIPLVDKRSKIIAQSDVKKVIRQARLLGVKMDEEMLHEFPQYYRVDDINTALNPVGLYGRKLEVDVLVLAADINRINNIIKAVNQAGLETAHLFFSGFAAATSVLNKKHKEDGSVLIDVGAGITNILIFKDGLLKYVGHLPWGGDHITRAIAKQMSLSFDLAEDIKKSYAVAIDAESDPEEEILVKREEGYMPIKKNLIFQAVDPEVGQFITQLNDLIHQSGLYDQLNLGVVMVGGGALLTGLIERIESSIHLPVAIGKITLGNKGISNASVFASAIGLAQEGFNQDTLVKYSTDSNNGAVKSFLNRVKELYQEYF